MSLDTHKDADAVKRLHRIYIVNAGKAECVDCRGIWLIEHFNRANYTDDQVIAELTDPTYQRHTKGYYAYSSGYCKASLSTYLNKTEHTLSLKALGLQEPIQPYSLFTLGNTTPRQTVLKHAPQVICVDTYPRSQTLGFSLLPYTASELVRYTVPEDLHRKANNVRIEFVSSPCDRFDGYRG